MTITQLIQRIDALEKQFASKEEVPANERAISIRSEVETPKAPRGLNE